MASSVLWSKKHGGSFGFHAAVAQVCEGDETDAPGDNCVILGVFALFPVWEWVLATEIGDPMVARVSNSVAKLTTDFDCDAVPDFSAFSSCSPKVALKALGLQQTLSPLLNGLLRVLQ